VQRRPTRARLEGALAVVDYARFIEIHTRHHCQQMPTAMAS
jgi:hypothetical protein